MAVLSSPQNAIDGNVAAFCATDTLGRTGEYAVRDGEVSVVANFDTPVPGGSGNFTRIDPAGATRNGTILFAGRGQPDHASIYSSRDGVLRRLVDTSTPIPGGTGTFQIVEVFPGVTGAFGGIGFDGRTIAFVGYGSGGQRGVYTIDTETNIVKILADRNTLLPGGSGTFTAFEHFTGPAMSNGTIVFAGGVESVVSGLYLKRGAEPLRKIVATGDMVDGKRVIYTLTSAGALDGDNLPMYIQFADGSEGIYLTTLPPALRLTGIERQPDGSFVIRWIGGAPPYQLQSRFTLNEGDWQNVGIPTDQTSAAHSNMGDAKFFRVLFGGVP